MICLLVCIITFRGTGTFTYEELYSFLPCDCSGIIFYLLQGGVRDAIAPKLQGIQVGIQCGQEGAVRGGVG